MMSANSFGSRFTMMSFGESHGPAMGVVVDGCPAGVRWDQELLLRELARRRPGRGGVSAGGERGAEGLRMGERGPGETLGVGNEPSGERPNSVVSDRNESDFPEILSGVFAEKTLGTPIAVVIRNQDARSSDYQDLSRNLDASLESRSSGWADRSVTRPGHADDVWRAKFGHSDPRGGGRSSGRETVSRVVAGSVAQMFLRQVCPGLRVLGFARKIGPFELSEQELERVSRGMNGDELARVSESLSGTDSATATDSVEKGRASSSPSSFAGGFSVDHFVARFPSADSAGEVEKLLLAAKEEGHSYGGIAEIWVDGVPSGLGQPVFHKLKADFASAFMGVGAVATVEMGDGLAATDAEGSEFHGRGFGGGADAGDVTGPGTGSRDRGANARVSSGARDTNGTGIGDTPYGGVRGGISTGERLVFRIGFKPTSSVLDVAKKGRHDPCIVPRAIPVLEAMTYLVLADHILWARGDRA